MTRILGGLCSFLGLCLLGWGIKELIFLRAAWGVVFGGVSCLALPWVGLLWRWHPTRVWLRRTVLSLTACFLVGVLGVLGVLVILHRAVRDQPILHESLETPWGSVQDDVFSAHGHRSSYRIFLPKRKEINRYSGLLVFLHGAGFTGRMYERWLASSFYPKAQKRGWIVAFPSAGSGADMVQRLWNDGSRPAMTKKLGIPKQKLWLRAWLNTLIKKFRVDARKVFLVGHSNGAAMALAFAALEQKPIHAVVSISGAISALRLVKTPVGSPLSILLVHGQKDALIPFEGRTNGKERVFVSAPEVLSYWAKHNGCFGKKPKQEVRPKKTKDTTQITIWHYPLGCKKPVALWFFAGGGHMLPGVSFSGELHWLLKLAGDGAVSHEISTASLVFDFFDRVASVRAAASSLPR